MAGSDKLLNETLFVSSHPRPSTGLSGIFPGHELTGLALKEASDDAGYDVVEGAGGISVIEHARLDA